MLHQIQIHGLGWEGQGVSNFTNKVPPNRCLFRKPWYMNHRTRWSRQQSCNQLAVNLHIRGASRRFHIFRSDMMKLVVFRKRGEDLPSKPKFQMNKHLRRHFPHLWVFKTAFFHQGIFSVFSLMFLPNLSPTALVSRPMPNGPTA